MTTRVFFANDGNDRLIVSTMRTRLAFFHEAGVAFTTERKVATPPRCWKPSTWRGFRWQRSADAEQPRNLQCLFNGNQDPAGFGATAEVAPGSFKLSCDSLMVRRHCVWVVQGDRPRPDPETAVEGRAAAVQEIELHFEYGGRAWTVRHASTLAALIRWPFAGSRA